MAPAAHQKPGLQAAHAALLELALGLDVPAAQGKHVDAAVAPCVALYVPDGHALHTVLGGALQAPGAQQVPAPALL